MVAGVCGAPVSALVAGLVVWYRNEAGNDVAGLIAQPTPATAPGLMMVANAVAVPPTWTERLDGRMAAASGLTAPAGPVTWTEKAPLFVLQPRPSTVPRKSRVAPGGTTNC